MRQLYFTSDLHVGHAKSIAYDKRPFANLEEMHASLGARFNATVRDSNAIVYFLGDVGFPKGNVLRDFLATLNPCIKILILGNHDGSKGKMLDAGFTDVLNAAMITLGDNIITMSHCPLRGVFREDITGMRGVLPGEMWHGESRHAIFSLPDFGQFHLHGHIHSGPANNKLKIDGRQFDVGVCGNNYRPVSISEIESWIVKTKQKISSGGAADRTRSGDT